MSTWLRDLKPLVLIILVIMALLTVRRHMEWATSVALWKVLRLPTPPASATYQFSVLNASKTDLTVGMLLLNEVDGRTPQSPRDIFIDTHHNRALYREQLLPSGQGAAYRIPFDDEYRLSYLLITAKGPVEGDRDHETQKFAWHLVPWKALRDAERDADKLLILTESDLLTLSADASPEATLPCPRMWPNIGPPPEDRQDGP